MPKIVLLTTDKPLGRTVANSLLQRFDDVLIVILREDMKYITSSFIRRALRVGMKRTAGQLLLFAYGALAGRRAARRRMAILEQHHLDVSPLPQDRVHRVSSINDSEAVGLLSMLAPDVVVVFHMPIISAHVLNCVGAPFINLHGGITPTYRGNHGAYWALVANDHENCGVTVHLIDEGIDTGDILYQARTRPMPDDNFFTYRFLQAAAGIPLLLRAVEDALNGSLRTYRRDDQRSALRKSPTLFEYLRNGWRSGVW